MSKASEFVSDSGDYIVPVSFEVSAFVRVSGCKNLQDALDVANKYIDEMPTTNDWEYIDGSYSVCDDAEIAMCYQDCKASEHFANPDKE